jgi:hypothetical protein
MHGNIGGVPMSDKPIWHFIVAWIGALLASLVALYW